LITGVYGSGKTSVVEEIADILESRDISYAALDLDWLCWAGAGGEGSDVASPWKDHGQPMMLRNLACVVTNYLDAGIERFVLAGALRNQAERNLIGTALAMPLRVVRLDVSLEEIERRLRSDVTSGRGEDLREAGEWLATGAGVGVEDVTISNERPIREVALHVIDDVGWPDATH
jgi:hypothetical protein